MGRHGGSGWAWGALTLALLATQALPAGVQRVLIDTTIPGSTVGNIVLDRDLHITGYTYEVYFDFSSPRMACAAKKVRIFFRTKNAAAARQLVTDLTAVARGEQAMRGMAQRSVAKENLSSSAPYVSRLTPHENGVSSG